MLAVALGGSALHRQAMRTLVGERDERAARAAAAAVTEQLNHRAAAVRGLALRAAADQDYDQILADISFLQSDFDGGLALLAANGTLLAATNAFQMWQSRLTGKLLADVTGVNGRESEVQFSVTFTDPGTGELAVLVSATADDLLAVGVFYPATLARRALTNVFSAGDQAAAFVVNADGQLLYQVGPLAWPRAELAQHPGVASALRGEAGTTYFSGTDSEHVIAFSPIPPVNWALVIEEPWRAVADPLLRTTEYAPLVLAPALIITLIAIWFGMRQIVEPLQLLEQKTTELAWGDFEAIEEPVGGIGEIQRLQVELIHMADKVKTAQQSLRGYLGAITTGQEEERRRLARELHDDTIQSLIALNQRIQLVQIALDHQPAADQLAEMQQMTTEIIADLRRFTHALRPIYLEDLGLVPALNMLARDASAAMGIPVEFETSGDQRRLQPEVELTLYRMAQEALSNVARHAQATRAALHLAFTADTITLTVVDNGRGFEVPESPAEMAPAGHFGLLGLHERAELIGAHLAIQSTAGEGTRLVITLPL